MARARRRKNHTLWFLVAIAVVVGAVIIFVAQAPLMPYRGDGVAPPTVVEPGVKVLEADFAFVTGKRIPAGTPYIVHPSQILAGGPPQGGIGIDRGIPALDMPKFTSAAEGDAWLNPNDLVLGI